ncbi:uncharacterized protein GGS22DRAFT_152962 [Annulohypoxylon maeteangense]|uniref:uncharacterized protein n=1 Tax=Annulohypoxylon maeteangense TaxID=1927788 RepID=UPI0020077EA2|nr:uncharacterized protein GGS22DRAFT_152962 [Annulohypoxylon maeteangense]KAI0889036.1 hypothetical protein GGS22DRAFT_152962 [Annulohypoxylon maeteangense]
MLVWFSRSTTAFLVTPLSLSTYRRHRHRHCRHRTYRAHPIWITCGFSCSCERCCGQSCVVLCAVNCKTVRRIGCGGGRRRRRKQHQPTNQTLLDNTRPYNVVRVIRCIDRDTHSALYAVHKIHTALTIFELIGCYYCSCATVFPYASNLELTR